MLIQPTIENLKMLKLFGMVHALESQMQVPDHKDLRWAPTFGPFS